MLFQYDQKIIHVKSGAHYIVVGLPHTYRLEHNNEPAYAYRSINADKKTKHNLGTWAV